MFRRISTLAFLAIPVWASAIGVGAPDLSTPKKSAVEFARDVQSGDLSGARAASIGSDDDFKPVPVISGLIRSALDLRAAAIEKFGDAGKQIVPNGDDLVDFAKRVESGIEKIDGDTATVGQSNEQTPMKLRKAGDGSWRVDLAAIPDKEEILKTMPKVQKVFDTGAAEIKSGKYKTAEQARNAIGDQMFAAISSPPTSKPAPDGPK